MAVCSTPRNSRSLARASEEVKVLEHLCCGESWDSSAWSRKGILSMDVDTWREVGKKAEPGSPHWAHRRPHQSIQRNSFTGGWARTGCPEGLCGVFTIRDVQKLLGHGPGQQALPCQAGWTRWPPEVLSQSKICDACPFSIFSSLVHLKLY